MQGFINIYKPAGCSSSHIVSLIKKKYNLSKVGHMGTLDPMAEGVLPIAVGKATRMFDYFLHKTKSYKVTMQFGLLTDTLDITGNVIDNSDVHVSIDDIKLVLPKFIGNISQVPPSYSAKNIGGRRAYQLARKGEEVALKPCNVVINDIELLDYTDNKLTLVVSCGSGTYIRSLVRDIGAKLGTYATMTYLKRLSSGTFNVVDSVDITTYSGSVDDIIIPIDQVFSNMQSITLAPNLANELCNGITLNCDYSDGVYLVHNDTELLCVGTVSNGKLKMVTYLKEEG